MHLPPPANALHVLVVVLVHGLHGFSTDWVSQWWVVVVVVGGVVNGEWEGWLVISPCRPISPSPHLTSPPSPPCLPLPAVL